MKSKQIPTARSVAADVLVRVEKDAAFAAAALDSEIDRAVQLPARDRPLATELVYGTLRAKPWLTETLKAFAPKGIGKLHPHVRAHLLLAAYQVFFLERIPPFAAVNEAVNAARHFAGDRVASFANAVLRRVAERGPLTEDGRRDAFAQSIPAWLRTKFEDSLGAPSAHAMTQNIGQIPAISLRLEHLAADSSNVDALIETWSTYAQTHQRVATFSRGELSPLAVLVRGAGRPQDLPGYVEGLFSIQEEGSQVVALALGAKEGETVLDACAGRGNKTGLLARAVGALGAVDAGDLHESKLAQLRAELARIHLSVRATHAVDWSAGAGGFDAATYDRVLVDAPCSGTGTIRRRPEIALTRTRENIAQLSELQKSILAQTASRVRPGGSLVYAVCSLLREESEDVVTHFLAAHPEFAAAPFDTEPLSSLAKGATVFRLLPHEHGTDGYFIARLQRQS